MLPRSVPASSSCAIHCAATFDRRRGDEVARFLVGAQQRFHLLAQLLVAAAGAVQKRRAALARQVQCGVKQLPDLLVLFGVHSLPLSSR